MHYEAQCPKGHRLQVTEQHFGQRVACPTCGDVFVVPVLFPADPGKPAAAVPTPPASKAAADSGRWKPALDLAAGMPQLSLLAGRPMVAVGLLLVLLARGCDQISLRGVERAEAKVRAAHTEFADVWQTKRAKLEEDIASEESKDNKARDEKAVADARTRLTELASEEGKDRRKQERGAWRDLEVAGHAAKTSQLINGYWREIFFVFASLVLAAGLLVVSWAAQGAERWITLIMLAIITVSLYIGGVAWLPMGH